MLKDGTLVNGSYEGFQRDIDHHEINQFYHISKKASPGTGYIYIKKFMNRGNIRVGCSSHGYTFEMRVPPTKQQFKRLVMYANEANNRGIEICFGRHSKNTPNIIWEDYDTWLYNYILKYMRNQYIDCI